MISKWLMIAVLAFCVAAVFAQEEMEVEDKEEPSTNVATSNSRATAGDLSFPVWLVSFLEHGGAVAAGILAVLALGMILVQTFGLRTCLLFNNCNDVANAHAYSSNGYPATDYYGTFNNPHTKRSLEYVGPVLKALSNAYVKYNKKVVSQPEKTA